MNTNKYRVISPAKINWHLQVYPKASPSQEYHEVNTILQTLNLHDTLFITFSRDLTESKIVCSGEFADDIKDIKLEDNLITKAINGIYNISGKIPEKYEIELTKNIPLRAGLGGGSSNAAAAIVVTCAHLGIDKDCLEVQEFASGLGADVPFFLKSGCFEMGGKGSVFIKRYEPYITPIVLVKPSSGITTIKCYKQFDKTQEYATNKNTIETCKTGLDEHTKRPTLYNSLQLPATQINYEVKDVIEFLSKEAGNDNVLLSGSGTCVFAICDDFAYATKLSGLAKLKGWWSRATYTSKVGASLIQ